MEKGLMGKEIVMFDVVASSKEEIIDIMTDALKADGRVSDKTGFIDDVMKREAISSTAVGFKIATPHAKSVHMIEPSLAFVKLTEPVKWDDEESVEMVFMIGVPSPGQGDRHLEILSSLFRKIVKKEFRQELDKVASLEDLEALIGNV